MGRSPKLKLGGGSLLDPFYKGVVLFGGLKKGPLVRELQICTLSGDVAMTKTGAFTIITGLFGIWDILYLYLIIVTRNANYW